jgi:hypothetical protein
MNEWIAHMEMAKKFVFHKIVDKFPYELIDCEFLRVSSPYRLLVWNVSCTGPAIPGFSFVFKKKQCWWHSFQGSEE